MAQRGPMRADDGSPLGSHGRLDATLLQPPDRLPSRLLSAPADRRPLRESRPSARLYRF